MIGPLVNKNGERSASWAVKRFQTAVFTCDEPVLLLKGAYDSSSAANGALDVFCVWLHEHQGWCGIVVCNLTVATERARATAVQEYYSHNRDYAERCMVEDLKVRITEKARTGPLYAYDHTLGW